MAGENEKPKAGAAAAAAGGGKVKKRKYLPHGRSVRKGPYPLRPRVQGFFITCDGGRERQAANDALSLLDTFYEELVQCKDSENKSEIISTKPVNKITKFNDSDSSGSEEESDVENANDGQPCEAEDVPTKKQRIEKDTSEIEESVSNTKEKTIDALIEDELKDLGDRNKRHFVSLDSGCNGCIFIQMNKRDGDPTPSSIVQHMMVHLRLQGSIFILRVLPAEVSCYASVDEITKEIKPLIAQYFPEETKNPQKYAVLYEARANSGIDRMAIINAVAKSVPEPHKVDLSNPDKTIIVEIVKTICLISVVEKYKELSKYNLRQLTIPEKKAPAS
ncbi:unnamed protein product [Spirodela intermedia]|uniref:THUMP domain-containing protein n=1 Tax=Spirodela intermedia TaxID=51605 RepID=A0A7I8J0S9_SPIIN|nr:unnamed protein product [Spirodela intermedia]CAA6663572.1 unnamed protein product [Spirodela intermedia]